MDPTGRTHGAAAFFVPLFAEAEWTKGLAPLVVCLIVVLVLSFLAAMVEAAFLSFPTARAKSLEDSVNAMERRAARLRLDFGKPLATMVIVNNATNIAGSMLAGFYASDYFEQFLLPPGVKTAMTVFTVVLTLVVIIWCEIVPKTIGEHHSLAVSKYASWPILALQLVLTPVLWLANFALRPFQHVGPHETTEEEIAELAAIGREQGAIEKHEGDMIRRVLRLNDITAEQIMTPRVDMIGLTANQTLDQAAEQLAQINRSLVPVYGKNRDEVVVILDRMDALLALAKGNGKLRLTDESVSFKPFYVPRTMPADELLVKFQRRTEHMAIVVGEYGDTMGLVTLEDVLEEIVGEIYDEEDIETGNGIERVADDEVLCEAAAEIKDVNSALSTAVPNHRSVAGFLLDELERIPAKGEEMAAHGLSFRIEDANERAILKVRIKRIPPLLDSEMTDAVAKDG